jgi:uncharacterized SAM-binding protein YcdF (DUF218 family)
VIAPRLHPPALWTVALLAPLALLVACAGGFVWFLRVANEPPPSPPLRADGIVVLTGGAERVETALHLLAEGRGGVLLVSGANRAAGFMSLAGRAHVDPALADRVTLGREAADTHGNAAETAAWVREKGIRSLIVVTAGYHMPRALTELSRALPDVALLPYPVISPLLREAKDPSSLRFLAGEYLKYLVALADLTGFTPLIAAAPPSAGARPAS